AGIVRQVFPYLAAEGATPLSLMGPVWEINVANLNLAAIALAQKPTSERNSFCDRLDHVLATSEKPERWMLLQQALGEIVRNPAIVTVVRCLVTYQFRVGAPLPMQPRRLQEALSGLERQIVSSLRATETDAAIQHHRAAQQCMTDWILSLGPQIG